MWARRAFTLTEVLVVLAILALLVMFFSPNLRGLLVKARTVKCANRLKHIGEAAHGRMAQGYKVDELSEAYWPGQIVAYLDEPRCLICPEATKLYVASGYVEDQIELKSNQIGIRFVEGPRIIKLSDTQWRVASIRETARRDPPKYVPDGSGIYWWGWEDGKDFDFQDMAVKVTTHADGSHTVWCQSWTSGHPEIWTPDHTRTLAYHHEINKYYFPNTNGKTLEPLRDYSESTYGMNNAMLHLRYPSKILALDYCAVIARSTDVWTDAKWDEDEDGLPDFARHEEKINVLFVDGSVKLKTLDEIDPASVSAAELYWVPQPGL